MRIGMTGICKSFSSSLVLNNVDFNLDGGEIHALLGENGAGKSTLMKILTGVYARDSGEILIDDKPVRFNHPREAEKSGVVFIHQELNSIPDLTVEENMFAGRDICGKFGLLNKKAMQKEVERVMGLLDVHIRPNALMGKLYIGQQQLVEISKAFLCNVKTIIMDEPTAALTLSETETLFRVVRDLKSRGVSVVYISHRMEEIFKLCDRVTVLRDGCRIDTKAITETNMDDLIRMMIGREIGERFPVRDVKKGDVALEVSHLTSKPYFQDISFSVRCGEVLGVSGLMGAGRTEIMRAIFGGLKIDSGEIKINGKKTKISSPAEAKACGLGFVTEDRKSEGLLLDESIQTNISLNNLGKVSLWNIVLQKSRERSLAQSAIGKLAIRSSGEGQICRTLSGGNQQKVVFAKWILCNPKVLILDEPTRGVDVGAKKEIYAIINALAADGVAIIMVSSDLPEVLGMSDRIMVIHEGRIGGVVEAADTNQEKIMVLATGGQQGVRCD